MMVISFDASEIVENPNLVVVDPSANSCSLLAGSREKPLISQKVQV